MQNEKKDIEKKDKPNNARKALKMLWKRKKQQQLKEVEQTEKLGTSQIAEKTLRDGEDDKRMKKSL